MRNRIFTALALIALALSVSGCSCGGDGGNPDSGLPDGSVGDSGTPDAGDSGTPPVFGTDGGTDGGPGSVCLVAGTSCTAGDGGGVCCSGICGSDGHCTEPTYCKGPQETCSSGPDCCSNSCINGACSAVSCSDVGQTCSADDQCCTGICGSDGTCSAISGQSTTCKVRGQACSSADQCCSDNCQGGVCVAAFSCQATDDVCYSDDQCCNALCSKNDGTPGVCQIPPATGASQCIGAGNPCFGSSSRCCSYSCTDPGSGTTVCQPAGGCKLSGETCFNDDQCCGGGINDDHQTTCSGADPATGTPGRCDQGQGCIDEGLICGAHILPDGGWLTAQQDCCNGQKDVCKLDSSGLPRCFGGGDVDGGSAQCPTGYDGTAGCCIAQGDNCQLSGQCCDGAKCVPAADGGAGYVCGGGSTTCLPLGTGCNAPDGGQGTGCCAGTVCGATTEFGWICQLPPEPSDGGTQTDAGTDGGSCAPNGTSCSTSATCCSEICGTGADGGQQCLTPSTCQPQGQSCTATGDCCSGLSCTVDPSTQVGTCQQSTCPGSGQTCSPTSPCCSGLVCVDGSYGACDGTSPCTCTVVIN